MTFHANVHEILRFDWLMAILVIMFASNVTLLSKEMNCEKAGIYYWTVFNIMFLIPDS